MRRSRYSNRTKPRPFHITWIFLICIAPVFASWFLIPRDLELAERLAEDGHSYRALSMLKEILPKGVISDSEGEIEKWQFPAMHALLTNDEGKRKRGGKRTRMIRILLKLSEEPERAFSLFQSNPEILSPVVARDFYDVIAGTALRQNKPSLAKDIYLSLDASHGLTDDLMMNAIQACRFCGSPKPALELMEEHARNKGVEVSELSRDKRMLVISLHRELNEGAKAFALLKAEFEHARTEIQRKELIELLALTAAQSNLFAESLPLLNDHVSKTQAAQLSWEELAVRPEVHPSDEEFTKYGTTLAQQLLWSGQLNASLDMFRKLALLNNEAALEQCVLITPWVNRKSDMGKLLASIDPLPTGKGYEKILIDSLCLDGEFAQAEKLLRQWIDDGHSDHATMRKTLADLVFEMRRYDESEVLYRESILAQKKNNSMNISPSLASLARNCVITGDFESALQLYREIPMAEHTAKTLGDYTYLANSMNSTEDILRGLDTQLRHGKKKVTSEVYLSMANTYESVGLLEDAQNSLIKGLEAFPKSRKMVLKSTEMLIKQRRHNDALEFLFSHYQHSDIRFHSHVLSLAVATKRQREVLEFLKLDDPRATSWPSSLRLALADIYESNLDYVSALAIYENVSPKGFEAAKNRLRAQVAYQEGNVEEAWQRQTAYIKMTTNPSPDELVFMGDLHRFTGRASDATSAYNAALAQLNRSIYHESVVFDPMDPATTL